MITYNFSAGPACFPDIVLIAVNDAIKQYKKTGMSILEISHRSKYVVELFEQTTERIKNLLAIPSFATFCSLNNLKGSDLLILLAKFLSISCLDSGQKTSPLDNLLGQAQ